MKRLEGKIAVVTGGSRGIGQAIVQRFLEEGAKVMTGARNPPAEMPRDENFTFVRTDVSVADDVDRLMQETQQRHGRLDVLVNNAAVQVEKTIENTTEEEFDWLMGINVKGVFLCCKRALAPMRASGGGSIVNIGSYDGYMPDPGLAVYSGSKGAVHALSRAIAVDHGKDGIRCNVICPGWIKTAMIEDYMNSLSNPAAVEDAVIAQKLVGRLGLPEDIAHFALFLASNESAFATGQLYVADGGLTAHAPFVDI